jgi:glycosyltransferase involved in cell wall biosynthesis
MNTLRITHLTQIIRGYGGVQRLLHEVVRRQAERGHEVQLLAIGSSDLEEDLTLGPGVTVSWFTTTRRIGGRYAHPPGLLRKIRAEAQIPGIIHAHQHFAPPTLLAALTRAPKVMTPYLHVQPGANPLSAACRGLQLRMVADRYRGGLVFLGESERRDFEALAHRRYPDSSVVAPGACEPDSGTEAFAKSRPIVLVVSRLVRSKQINRVIEAVAASVGGARLVVVGHGPERGALEATCKANGLDPSTTLLGSVDDETLGKWYRTADVVVSLSQEESFGLTLLEAASAGAALLVSDIPAHRDALGVTGPCDSAIVPVDSGTEKLAEALDRLLVCPRQQLPRKRTFRTWDDTVDELESVYRRVLNVDGRNG